MGRSRQLHRRFRLRLDHSDPDRADHRRLCPPSPPSAGLTARWGWYSALLGVQRWSSLPISLGKWFSRSNAWPDAVLDARTLTPTYEAAVWVRDQVPDPYRRIRSSHPRPEGPLPPRPCCTPIPRDAPPARPRTANRSCRRWRSPAAIWTMTHCTRNAGCSASGTSPTPRAVTALGLHALQHRGQEATGITSFDGVRFHSHRGMGLVGDNFGDARIIERLPGRIAIGHNRYATTGDTILRNVQPLIRRFRVRGLRRRP